LTLKGHACLEASGFFIIFFFVIITVVVIGRLCQNRLSSSQSLGDRLGLQSKVLNVIPVAPDGADDSSLGATQPWHQQQSCWEDMTTFCRCHPQQQHWLLLVDTAEKERWE